MKNSADKALLQSLQRQRRQLSMKGILDFSGIKTNDLSPIGNQQMLVELILNDSTITSFSTLQEQKKLKSIIADNSKVQVLSGLSSQPRLSSISLKNTPISKNEYFRIEVLISVGPRISSINGTPVTQMERKMAQCYPPVAKSLIDVGWILQYPPPSKDDFIYLVKQFNIKNVNKEDYNAPLPPPEKVVSSVQSPKKDDENSAVLSTNQNDQTQNESEIEDDRSFCEKVAAILRPLGFAIRNGPDMVGDLTKSVQNICDVVKKIEDIDLDEQKNKSKK